MILVDGDVVRYRCGFASQKTRYIVNRTVINRDGDEQSISVNQFDNAKEANAWMKDALDHNPDDKLVRFPVLEVEPLAHALRNVQTLMDSIQQRYPEHAMTVFFSCPTANNWRTQFYPQYKANRKPRKAEHDADIQKYMQYNYHYESNETMEADDLISIWAHEHKGSIIATNDKDMDQIPGVHYDFTKTHEYTVLPHEAAYGLELQTVAGDSTDNIPGVPGLGLKKAAAALHTFFDADMVYREHYETQEAAWYWYLVNQALVSLPTDIVDIDTWTREIGYARKAFQDLPEDGESGVRSTGRTGTNESGSPTAEEGV